MTIETAMTPGMTLVEILIAVNKIQDIGETSTDGMVAMAVDATLFTMVFTMTKLINGCTVVRTEEEEEKANVILLEEEEEIVFTTAAIPVTEPAADTMTVKADLVVEEEERIMVVMTL